MTLLVIYNMPHLRSYPALYRNFSVIKEAVAMNNKVSGFVDFSKKKLTHILIITRQVLYSPDKVNQMER